MVIQETILRDIVDVMSDVKDSDVIDMMIGKNNKRSMKSITSKARDLTLVFPVICSKHLTIESASIVAKSIERQAAAMLQIVMAACASRTAKDGYDFISNFHTNLDTGGMSMDKFLNTLDKLVDEGTLIPTDDIFYKMKDELQTIVASNNIFNEDINENSLSRFTIHNMYGNQIVTEADGPDQNDYTAKDYMTMQKNRTDVLKNNVDALKNQLITTDVKKANELLPTMMTVQFVGKNADGEKELIPTVFVIGVKAKIYPVDSEDILNRIKIKHSDRNLTLNLIRATTNEIGFFKDFLFAIDKAKLDAVSQSERGTSSKLWKILERRALKSKVRRSMFMKNDATAITTIAISQDEAEYLMKTTGINIEDPRVAREILDAYNLIGFVICDEVSEVASFIFDTGDDMYEQITYDNLERDAGDRSTKKILNLVSKTSR